MQTSIRETYSLLKKDLKINVLYNLRLSLDPTYVYDPQNINNFVRRDDGFNCYVEDDNEKIILLADKAFGNFKKVTFHRFYIIYDAYYYETDSDVAILHFPKITNDIPFYLCCNHLPNSSKIAIMNDDDTYHSEATAYINDDSVDCYLKHIIHYPEIVKISDLDMCFDNYLKNIVKLSYFTNRVLPIMIKIKDIVIDAEWKL